jgi:arsenite-transporting ATPase
MAFILTFLGKGSTGRTTVAIAASKAMAAQGKRVLLLGQDSEPSLSLLLEGAAFSSEPREIAPNLSVADLSAAQLLEQSWDEVKQLEAQYIRTPFFKNVYGQELSVLPGMDAALGLYALKGFDASDRYDVIVYDNPSSATVLRMFSLPDGLSWYLHRFRQVFLDSDLAKGLAPFVQPIASTILNNPSWGNDNLSQPFSMADDLLSQGRAAVANPQRVAAYLVTTVDPLAVRTAQKLWGAAQQVNVTVGGLLLNQSAQISHVQDRFNPLRIHSVPARSADQWQPLMDMMPPFQQEALQAPKPLTIDVAQRQVKIFLPGVEKSQVQLTQYGPELTLSANDQRRNIFLPPELKGQKVTGAKFQEGYLIISF